MKNAFWIFFTLIIAAACSGPSENFNITGEIGDASPGWVVLSKVVDNDLVPIDSVETTDGTFRFSGTIGLPEAYFLEFKADQKFFRFFVEPGEINIGGNIEEPEYEGSETQAIYESYGEGIAKLDEQRNALYGELRTAMNSGDTARIEEIRMEAQNIDDNQNNFTIDFIKSNADNTVGPYVAVNNMYQFQLDDLVELRSAFPEAVAGSKYITIMDEQIGKLQDVAIGQTAPLFTQNDSVGNPVSLESLRGNYLLIDFWASWCSPCRRENPNIVAAYQKFHDKGFDILGVSLDKDKSRWLEAIEDDKLTWTHVSDLKGWQNEASNRYGVSSIPASFLLDPEGVIIAKDLREEALHEKLEEIFNQ